MSQSFQRGPSYKGSSNTVGNNSVARMAVRTTVRTVEQVGAIFGYSGLCYLAAFAAWYFSLVNLWPVLLVFLAGVVLFLAGLIAVADLKSGRGPSSGEQALAGCFGLAILLVVAAIGIAIYSHMRRSPETPSHLISILDDSGLDVRLVGKEDSRFQMPLSGHTSSFAHDKYGARDAVEFTIDGGPSLLALRYETEKQASTAATVFERGFAVYCWAFAGGSDESARKLRRVLQ